MTDALLNDIIGTEPMNTRTKSINYYNSSKMVNKLLLGSLRNYILCVMALKSSYNSLTNGSLISIGQKMLRSLENTSATIIIEA